jgi:hypothetical protein
MTSRREARRNATALQARRDLVAAEIWKTLSYGGAVPRFGLYLRSFFTGNKLAVVPEVPQKPIYLFDRETVSPVLKANTDHLDYEAIFVNALGEECPLIAVREAVEAPQGAGRVRLDPKDWQQQIAYLVAHAAIIICFPSNTEGTTWEFGHLISVGALGRTAILMPEDPLLIPRDVPYPVEASSPRSRWAVVGNLATRYFEIGPVWQKFAAVASSYGVPAWPYAPSGALFRIDETKKTVGWIDPLCLSLLERRSAYVAEVLAHHGLTPWRRPATKTPLIAFHLARSRNEWTAGMSMILHADAYIKWGHLDLSTGLLVDAFQIGPQSARETQSFLAALARDLLVDTIALPPGFRPSVGAMIERVLLAAGVDDQITLGRATRLQSAE